MSKYFFETYMITTGDILLLPQGWAEEFDLGRFHFKKSRISPDFGRRYIIQFEVEADGWEDLITKFNSDMISLEDSMAFYYSMPFIWEWWSFIVKKDGDEVDRTVISVYKKIPGVVMSSHLPMPEDPIFGLMKLAANDERLASALHYYNSLCRVDTLEYSRVHLAVMYQLVDSIAEQEVAKGCKHCGRQDYTRTSREDIKRMLGDDLYKDLYISKEGGEQTARNATMHGTSNASSLSKITVGHVEQVLVAVRKRLIEKYELKDISAAEGRVDVARYLFSREGARFAVASVPDTTIDDYYESFNKNNLRDFEMKPVKGSW